MTIYFLQVGAQGGQPILPPVEQFSGFTTLAAKRSSVAVVLAGMTLTEFGPAQQGEGLPNQTGCQTSVGDLLRKFFQFYAHGFNFQKEAICIRKGKRAPPSVALPLHVIVHSDGVTTSVGPSIEDPFDRKDNVGANMTECGFLRLKEEFERAARLCTAFTTSPGELLDLWSPSAKEGVQAGLSD